jgi:hypothetical protein
MNNRPEEFRQRNTMKRPSSGNAEYAEYQDGEKPEPTIASSAKKPKLKKKFASSFGLAIVIIIATWCVLSVVSSRLAWKAVVLENGQIFFGRFSYVPFRSTVALHNAHYMKSGPSAASSTVSDFTVLPVTGDVHGPTDTMIIRKDHIQYYQVIRSDTTLYKGLSESVKK